MLTKTEAQQTVTQWWQYEQQIADLKAQTDALRRRQKPLHIAITEWATANADPNTRTALTGNRETGFRLQFDSVPLPIKWKDLLIERLTDQELKTIEANRQTKPELTIQPRNIGIHA